MLRINCLSVVFCAACAIFSSADLLLAEDKYMLVGHSSSGNPMYLDLDSVQGTNFRLYSQFGTDLIGELGFFASCGDKRLFATRIALYDASGKTVTAENTRKDVSATRADSAPGTAMQYVCRKIRAAGW